MFQALDMSLFFKRIKTGDSKIVRLSNCTLVTINVHTFCTAAIATVSKLLLRLLLAFSLILIIYANLIINANAFKFCHKNTHYLA